MTLLNLMKLDGATAIWALDEPSGTTMRDSVGPNHGTLSGTATLAQKMLGDESRCVLFGGGLVTVNDSATFDAHVGASGQASLECVLALNSLPAVMTYPVSKAASPYELGLSVTPAGVVEANAWDGLGSGVQIMKASSSAVATGVPVHILMTYNRATPKIAIYVNGVVVTNGTIVNPGSIANSSSVLTIAKRADGYGSGLDGKIGPVAYYPTELSASQADAHYRTFIRGGVAY